MRAVVYEGYGAAAVVREVAAPECPRDGVVVTVAATGVCRSDWHAWRGHEPVALPHIPGHELAGIIAEVGPHGRPRRGDRVAVYGCGGVGLSAVMIAAALGARVIAIDVVTAALTRARELGAELAIDATATDPVAAITELGGAHVSIDALGSAATAVASVRCLRRRGRHVQVGLLPGPAATPPIPMDLVIAKELEIHGSHGMAARDYPPMMSMVADGTLRPGLLLGRVIGLAGAGAALAAMDEPAETAGVTVIDIRLP